MVASQHARWAAMIQRVGMLADCVGKVPFKSLGLILVAEDVAGHGGYGAGVHHGRSVIVGCFCGLYVG